MRMQEARENCIQDPEQIIKLPLIRSSNTGFLHFPMILLHAELAMMIPTRLKAKEPLE